MGDPASTSGGAAAGEKTGKSEERVNGLAALAQETDKLFEEKKYDESVKPEVQASPSILEYLQQRNLKT